MSARSAPNLRQASQSIKVVLQDIKNPENSGHFPVR